MNKALFNNGGLIVGGSLSALGCILGCIFLIESPTSHLQIMSVLLKPSRLDSLDQIKNVESGTLLHRTWDCSIVDKNVESLLLLHDILGKLSHRVQRGEVQKTQVDILVSRFLFDLFDRRRPPWLAATGQDNAGPTLGKVQGNALSNPW